ncbi:RHS repeat domain-containing protein, partial [Sphingobacterium haloxyli]
DYVSGIEYKKVGSAASAIEMIHTEEGYLQRNANTNTYTYHYNLTDHLGNVRATLQQTTGDVIQKHDYYPFGKAKALVTSGVNKYLYNGKEQQDELGGQYDYGARFYDAEIGRFNVIDRFAEKYYSMTPYQYGGLDPIKHIDVNGDSLTISFTGGITWGSTALDIGTPIGKMGAQIGVGEYDVIGVRDNNFYLFGSDVSNSTERSKTFVEGNFLGFGVGTSSNVEVQKKIETIGNVTTVTPTKTKKEEVYFNTPLSQNTFTKGERVKSGLSKSMNLSAKIAVGVGIEFGVKITDTSPSKPGMTIDEMLTKHLFVPIEAIEYQKNQRQLMGTMSEIFKAK